jgi:ribosomal protein L37E
MIICNRCGASFDTKQSHCTECGARVDEAAARAAAAAKTREKVTAERPANPRAPARGKTGEQSTKASPPAGGKTVAPPHPSASQASANDSPSHEEMMALLHSLGRKVVRVRRSVSRHGKAVVGGLTAIFLVLLGIFGQELWQRWQHPQPVTIWIEVDGNVTQWKEGEPLKLTARTYPPEYVPRDFKWKPVNMIEGNGQQSVTLNTTTSDRHTESYPVTVGLVAFDQIGNSCVNVKDVTITIVPPPKWNREPEVLDLQIKGNPRVMQGTAVTVEATATDKDDKDRDKLTYNWSVGNDLVVIEGNGSRKVVLKIPKDFAKLGPVPLSVRLTVSDSIATTDPEYLPLIVDPGGSVRIARPKPKTVTPKPAASPTQPGASPPAKVESTPSMAAPQSPPHSQEPGRP